MNAEALKRWHWASPHPCGFPDSLPPLPLAGRDEEQGAEEDLPRASQGSSPQGTSELRVLFFLLGRVGEPVFLCTRHRCGRQESDDEQPPQ